ncbi:MAG: dienelactone hydrolase family protein, partial [Nevskia sp.]|nr:dienelactone hydrolase family protein [Nevskia sp.]
AWSGAAAAGAAEAQQQGAAMAAMHHDDAPVASPAAQVPPAVPVTGQEVSYGSVGGKPVKGYFAKPAKAAANLPGVILYHEWWGLNDNIRHMADRLAGEGYLVLAADLYGGRSAEQPDQAQALMQQAIADGPAIDANIEAAYSWLKDTAKAAKIGTVGWCFGGSISFQAGQVLGERSAATVIYYGFVNDHADELAKMKAPVLGLFGGKDGGIPVTTVQGFQKGLEAQNKHPLIHVYPDAGHAFANPSGKNYRKDDAEDAWKRTLAFLGQYLKG